MKNLQHYFKKAQDEKFAIAQFNFSDLSQMEAIVAKSAELKSPVILGTSEGESKFFGMQEAVALRDVLRKKTGLPIFLNLDHGKSFEYLKEAVDAGYDMVHFDGSKLSFEENVATTKQVVAYAKKYARIVEGEMGHISTDSSQVYDKKFEIKEEDLTKPEEAQNYVTETGVDLLAISVGNFHGIELSGTDPHLRLDVLEKIKEKLGRICLVLHGGSGTPDEDVKKAIQTGIVKININTEIRLAFSANLKKALGEKDAMVPYKYLPEAQKAVEKVVAKKITLFGSADRT